MLDHTTANGYTLRLLGGASLEREAAGQTGPAAQRHRLALLAMLAASYPRGLTRDKLIGCLWPERDTEAARNLLKQSVHVLRRALGEPALLSAGEEIRLGPDALQCDVIDFEQALERDDLVLAVRLYAGPFLDGFFLSHAPGFEQWVDEQRQRFRHRYRGALDRLAADDGERGEWASAVEWLRPLLADDPCNAAVTMRLMHALDRSGDRTGAIRQARLHAALLEQELATGPDPNVVALAEWLASAPPSELRPLTSLPARSLAEPGPPARATPRRSRRAYLAVAASILVLGVSGWGVRLASRSAESHPVRRLAVLPLDNLTGDPAQDYFVAGLHDALVTELGLSPDLTVISRQSVLRHAGGQPPSQLARELNVEALVEGSVIRIGDSVQISVKLVRAAGGEQLGVASHRDASRNALVLPRQLAVELTQALRARLEPNPIFGRPRYVPKDPDSQDLYLRGLHHLGQFELGTLPRREALDTLRRSITYFQDAVGREPDWAAAHASLGHAYHWLASTLPASEREYYPKARAAVERALQLDPFSARAHASLGFIAHFFENDWLAADRSYRQALAIDPNSYHGHYGLYLSDAGRYSEAIDRFRLAEERDPRSRMLKRQLTTAYYCAGRYDDALAQAEHVAQLWPDVERVLELNTRGNVYTATGRHRQAISAFTEAIAASDSAIWALAGLAYALARAGDARAWDVLPMVESRGGTDGILFAAMGDHERAVAAIEAAVNRSGRRAFYSIRCFPEFAGLRRDPRIDRLARLVLPID